MKTGTAPGARVLGGKVRQRRLTMQGPVAGSIGWAREVPNPEYDRYRSIFRFSKFCFFDDKMGFRSGELKEMGGTDCITVCAGAKILQVLPVPLHYESLAIHNSTISKNGPPLNYPAHTKFSDPQFHCCCVNTALDLSATIPLLLCQHCA